MFNVVESYFENHHLRDIKECARQGNAYLRKTKYPREPSQQIVVD